MKKYSWLLCLFTFGVSLQIAYAQDTTAVDVPDSIAIELILPDRPYWNFLEEGQRLEFTVQAKGGTGGRYRYTLKEGKLEGMLFDSLGRFAWTPSYDFVDRLKASRRVQVLFEVRNENNESDSKMVEFRVRHVNRPPIVGDLKPFYVRYNTLNIYTIDQNIVKDEDNDPIVFVPIPASMPEGAQLSSQGEFTWKPSLTQFSKLKQNPLTIEFYVEDQPSKSQTKGQFRVEATSMDLPPSISMVPEVKTIQTKEDATVNLKFYLTDPNGEGDIANFGFVADNPNVPESAVVKNAPTNYEFIWKPGYNFVNDPHDSLTFTITFFVIDKAQKREQKTIEVTVYNAINEYEIDRKLYTEYRTALVRGWDLLEQLKDTERALKKRYRKATKGKKGRSIANASVGAVTGVAPVVVQTPTTSKTISTIGGTTVMTMGTLEATEVIGKSTKDLIDRLNYVMEKKNEVQLKGDIFARKYSLRSSRRKPEFIREMDEFLAIMNLKGLVALELDAGWQNKAKATDENLNKTFKDFSPEEEFTVNKAAR